MDIIHDIELVKFGILDELYTLFPTDFFLSSHSVPCLVYKHLCAQFWKIEDLFKAVNFQWWDKFFLQKESALGVWETPKRVHSFHPPSLMNGPTFQSFVLGNG